MKIRVLEDFTEFINGKSIPFRVGDEIDLDKELAKKLVLGHYAELVKPAVKIVDKYFVGNKAVKA